MPSRLPRVVLYILALALAARILFAAFLVDLGRDYYWEYGEMAKYVIAGKGLAYFYFDGDVLKNGFQTLYHALPTAFMSPGYVLGLLPFLLVPSVPVRNVLLIGVQTVLSLVTIVLLYRYTAERFSKGAAICAAAGVAVIPEFVYSACSYTPTVVFHLLIVLVLAILSRPLRSVTLSRAIGIGALFSATVYFRMEAVFFLLAALGIKGVIEGWRKPLLIAGLMVLFCAPWPIRNAAVFHAFVPLTTSGGYNLFRGQYHFGSASGPSAELESQIAGLPRDDRFEVEYDRLLRSAALERIVSQPAEAVMDTPAKVFNLWGYSTLQHERTTPVYVASAIAVLLLSLCGMFLTISWSRHWPLYVFLLYSTALAIVFFTFPRHQVMMKIGLLPFAGHAAYLLLRRIPGARSALDP